MAFWECFLGRLDEMLYTRYLYMWRIDKWLEGISLMVVQCTVKPGAHYTQAAVCV